MKEKGKHSMGLWNQLFGKKEAKQSKKAAQDNKQHDSAEEKAEQKD